MSTRPPLPPTLLLEDMHRHTMRLMVEEATRAVNSFIASTQARYAAYIGDMAPMLAKHSDEFARQAEDFAERGWYPDPHLTPRQMKGVLAIYEAGSFRKADRMLADYYDSQLSPIQSEIAEAYPNRASILRAAIWAHRRRKYILSVPALLIQADGVCFDAFGTQLFQRRDGVPATASHVGKLDRVSAAYLAPLTKPIPITASQHERTALRNDELFRHAVLHGEDVDYGTRVNSCKAISLFRYLAWLLPK